ncbi:MAG: nucleoside-triphosphatase [Saprospiraceae bacterium]
MNKLKNVSDVWLKAAILGSTWAASEIILGSFLHNLRIPFNGNILTMIGFIVLISASYIWKDRGLFWRSGLICALMKTMSPSAVIFGPMIAIFIEATLLDMSVRIFGRNTIGFLIGSALAMSWILVQKILNMIIFYGLNIVEIYKSIIGFAEKQLHTSSDLVWMPILILLVIYLIFGIADVIIGMRIGKSLLKKDSNEEIIEKGNKFNLFPRKQDDFDYSISWLLFNFIALIAMLFILNWTPIYIWVGATIIVILIWITRYKRAMRQLMKPSFWIFFVIITMLSAVSITAFQDNENKWISGIIIGVQMNFRAAVVILGFTVLGTELYNPKIRNYFAKTSFKQLPIALELAFESLPEVVNNLPEVKYFIKSPTSVIKHLINKAEERFNVIKTNDNINLALITGNIAEGKTSCLLEIIKKMSDNNIKIGGFYSPLILTNDTTIGYDLVHIRSNQRIPFLRENDKSDIGKYKVDESAFNIVAEWIENDKLNNVDVFIIDEVGKWELSGKGWSNVIDKLKDDISFFQIWTVRSTFVDDVILKWGLENVLILNTGENTNVEISEKIYNLIKK